MPNTAPDVTTGAIQRHISVRLIDKTGDKAADDMQIPVAATLAQIEAYKDAYAAVTSANLYAVNNSDWYNAVPDKTPALEQARHEVSNVMNILIKTPAGESDTIPLRAPIPDLFIDESDNVDPAEPLLATYLTALLTLRNVGRTGGNVWQVVSIRYTGRKQTNQAVPI